MAPLFLYVLLQLFSSINAQCSFNNGLDLSPLSGLNIQCVFELDSTQTMQFSPCASNLQCTWSDLDSYMVTQSSISGNCLAGIAKLDSTAPEQTTVDGQNAYKFSYTNGQVSFGCLEPRTLDLTFVCDESADPYNENGLKCGENSNQICAYYLTIPTKYACVSPSANESNALSTGSVLLILLFVFVCAYCIGGYIFNGMRNPDGDWKDFEYNCPNYSFWKVLPLLVGAGCSVSYHFVRSKLGKESDDYAQNASAYNALE